MAITGATFATPPPWPAEWCVNHDAVWSNELSDKHALATNSESFTSGCDWSWDSELGDRGVGVGVTAGTVGGRFAAVQRPRAQVDAVLGVPVVLTSTANSALLSFWSDNPPYHLGAGAKGMPKAEAIRRVRALADDVLKTTNHEAFRKPRAELVFIYPNHPERARLVLENWDRFAPLFEATVPLPKGFPKLVNVNDFTWDPGKRPGEDWHWRADGSPPPKELLLMAVCPSGAGKRLVDMTTVLPPTEKYVASVAIYVASAEGLAVECPAAPAEDETVGTSVRLELADGNRLSAMSVRVPSAQPGEVAFYGTMIYSNAAGLPLDYLPFELRKPEAPTTSGGIKPPNKMGKCDALLDPNLMDEPKVRLVCEVLRSERSCRHYLGVDLNYEVVDGKLRVEEVPLQYPGRDCGVAE